MIVHLLDGTYELFRHFYGARRWNKGKEAPLGAVRSVGRALAGAVGAALTATARERDAGAPEFHSHI